MGRLKGFDPDTALRQALELFWRQGYEATSMQDVVDHLGIGRASAYATFGSKRELYLKALERYVAEQNDRWLRALMRGGRALPVVRQLIRTCAEETLGDPEHRGCLVTNGAAECLPGDEALERQVRADWDGLETLLRGALLTAQDQGDLAADRDAAALARFLVVFVQGIRITGKCPDRARMDEAVEQALTLLD